MKKIFVSASNYDVQEKILSVADIHFPEGYSIETKATLGQDINFWKKNPYDLLIIRIPDDPSLYPHYQDRILASVPVEQPMILICEKVETWIIELSKNFQAMRILKAKSDAFEVYRAVLDLIGDQNYRKTAMRFSTDQNAKVLDERDQFLAEGKIKNLSQGGVYVEISDLQVQVSPSDKLKVEISIEESNKVYRFDIEIRWVQKKEDVIGFGACFTSQNPDIMHLSGVVEGD